ncbi:MAG: tRNA pseudouridine(13) synthase TruD [Candidatus Nanoarchaeia archaeon]|nr:tRNA pseudouridine(13) synthase TruD [Candidatus Nanoarchaeia archaeon]
MAYTTTTEGTKGDIKLAPEDFIVEEVRDNGVSSVNYSFNEKIRDIFSKVTEKNIKKYIECDLVKKNWETPKSIKFIAKKLGISEKRIRYAGLKDKKAITSQRISIERKMIRDVKKVRIKDLILKNFKYTDERLSIGGLKDNRFIITVRNCSQKNKNLKKTVSETAKQIEEHGIYNYFGEQRFSRANIEIAESIIKGDYEKAVKILLTLKGERESPDLIEARNRIDENWGEWKSAFKELPKRMWIESAVLNHLVKYPNDFIGAFRKIRKSTRKIIINAYQSYLFNMMIDEFKDEFESLPLIGYDSEVKEKRVDEFLKSKDISREMFRIKSMPEMNCRGTERKVKIYPENIELKKVKGNNYTVAFSLSKGCYATVVMREFIK